MSECGSGSAAVAGAGWTVAARTRPPQPARQAASIAVNAAAGTTAAIGVAVVLVLAGSGCQGGDGCPGGAVFEPLTATCEDPRWAAWPMPNDLGEVAAGAPNPASHTDNGDGTITDNVTGLLWQSAASEATYDWAGANDYCASLTLAGHDDWRLPSRIELVSIVDRTTLNPSIDNASFPGTMIWYYWSSSPFKGSTSSAPAAWVVYFGWGYTAHVTKTTLGAARCVRTGASSAPARATGPDRYAFDRGVARDTRTGLFWQQLSPAATSTWDGAKPYCAALDLNGLGWRVPTIQEMQTIVDESRIGPALDPEVFPAQHDGDYWAATSWSVGDIDGWKIDLHDGSTNTYSVNALNSVRCVR